MQVDGAIVPLEPTAAKGIEYDITLPAERVWSLLPLAYDALGLPLTTLDTQRRVIAAGGVRAQGRLRSTPLSRYLECGAAIGGVPLADSYLVMLDVQTQLVPSGDGARAGLNTAVRATARSASTGSNTPVNCTSTGTLERRVAEMVREQNSKMSP
jgi:hypothetical protein